MITNYNAEEYKEFFKNIDYSKRYERQEKKFVPIESKFINTWSDSAYILPVLRNYTEDLLDDSHNVETDDYE